MPIQNRLLPMPNTLATRPLIEIDPRFTSRDVADLSSFNAELPQVREGHDVIVRSFDRHLGRRDRAKDRFDDE
jgi:hypothetical protein